MNYFYFGIDKLTKITNEIYDNGEITEDLSRRVSIALPKKPTANECKLHRGISLLSHISKLTIMILMNIACSTIRPEIEQGLGGFGKDTVNKR